MTDTMKVIIGVLLPFLGTTLGAASVFFMKGEMNPKLQKALLGFASGVMIAASVWSLIMPGIEMAEAAGKIAWLPAAAGSWPWPQPLPCSASADEREPGSCFPERSCGGTD